MDRCSFAKCNCRNSKTTAQLPICPLPMFVLAFAHRLGHTRRTGLNLYFTEKSFSNNSFDSVSPCAESRMDLALVAGSEM